jgi:hypothetical protein
MNTTFGSFVSRGNGSDSFFRKRKLKTGMSRNNLTSSNMSSIMAPSTAESGVTRKKVSALFYKHSRCLS